MCTKLEDVFLNISTKTDKCQVIHIHNDELARFTVIAKFDFKMVKNGWKIKNIIFRLKSQETFLYFSIYRVSIHKKKDQEEGNHKYKLRIILKPLSSPVIETYTLGMEDKNIIINPNKNEYISNEVKFLIEENTFDRLKRKGNVGDQACNFKII